MEQLTRYRIPVLTAVGAIVVGIVVFLAWISPEGSKLSSLQAQETQLQSQAGSLRTELASLKRDKAQLATNCAELTKDLTQVPGVPTVDAFFHQVTALAVSAGDPNTPSISVTQAPGGAGAVKAVAVSLTLTGTYGQMAAFLKGLDTFPRLFTITSITVTGGSVAIGGQTIAAGTGGYNLSLTGSIFYSTGQVNVCADATTTSAH